MGLFPRRRNISGYLFGANKYIRKYFREEPQAQYSEKLPVHEAYHTEQSADSKRVDGPRYSLSAPWEESDENGSPTIKCSQRVPESAKKQFIRDYLDRYDPDTISRLLSGQVQSRNVSALNETLEQSVDQSFVEKVIELIRIRDVKDSAVYKAAQIDRRLFSKMMSDRSYKPSKDTAIAIALALKLYLSQANDLLSRAGYTLSHSSKRDVVIEYFIRERHFNLTDINLVLDKLGMKPIGR